MTNQYSRRSFLATASALGVAIGAPSLAHAQSFPEKGKAIRAIVPFPAGSTSDTLARPFTLAMGETLGTTVVVDNKAGADGVIGMRAVKASPPDGYTILFTSLSTQVMNPHLFKELPYDPLKDFIPLAGTMKSPLMVNVGPSIPFKTATEFFAAAKANPKKYTYASVSATTRIAGHMLSKAAGIELVNVAYKGFGDLVSNLIAGKVDILIADGPAVKPYFSQGVRSLAVASLNRFPPFPDVPTLQEQGLKGFEIVGWHAAYVPANTPAAVVTQLRDAVRKAVQSKYVKEYYTNFGVEPLDLAGDDLAAFQKAEYEKWGQAIREAGMAGTV